MKNELIVNDLDDIFEKLFNKELEHLKLKYRKNKLNKILKRIKQK